jgi:hypothetical protein
MTRNKMKQRRKAITDPEDLKEEMENRPRARGFTSTPYQAKLVVPITDRETINLQTYSATSTGVLDPETQRWRRYPGRTQMQASTPEEQARYEQAVSEYHQKINPATK